jgi:hypothetical protein
MAVYSLPATCKRVVLGTGMTNFNELIGSGGAKGSVVFNFKDQPSITFPYVQPEQTIELLGKFFHLEEIEPSQIEAAKKVMQGRLRHVFRFIPEMYLAAKNLNFEKKNLDRNAMNAIFQLAVNNLGASITRNIRDRLKRKEQFPRCKSLCFEN